LFEILQENLKIYVQVCAASAPVSIESLHSQSVFLHEGELYDGEEAMWSNLLLTGDDDEEIQKLRKYLSDEFEIKDLGSLKYFLGIEVARSRYGIFVSQQKYVLDLLNETRMLGCKAFNKLVEQNKKLKESDESSLMDKGSYLQLDGRIMDLSHTHPNIAYVVSVVSH
jgi:hypothetical protein